MADYAEDHVEDTPSNVADVEMDEGAEEVGTGAGESVNGSALPFAEEGADDDAGKARTAFITYLTSPVVTLIAGMGDSETIRTAHQSLLTQSPWFQEACAEFTDDGSVCSPLVPPALCFDPGKLTFSNNSPARSSWQTTTSTPSAPSSNSSIPATTSRGSCRASEHSSRTH
jgi:hypothetical protein